MDHYHHNNHKLLREPRLQTMDGQAKTGIEIYTTLQKPSENIDRSTFEYLRGKMNLQWLIINYYKNNDRQDKTRTIIIIWQINVVG